jgi:phage tail-like protein
MPNLSVDSLIVYECKNPRVALDTLYMYNLLPEVYREADSTQGLPLKIMFQQVLGTRLNTIVANIQDFPLLVSYEYCPSYVLDHLLYNVGNPFPVYQLNDISKRKLIALLISIYKAKGTYNGILLAVQAVTGLSITITVPWLDDSWTLGFVDELGVTTHVNALRNDRYNYTFIVHIPTSISSDLENLVRLVINYMKPLYTHYIIAPPAGAPPVINHWELGLSELGYNTFLHTNVPILFIHRDAVLMYEAHGFVIESKYILDEFRGSLVVAHAANYEISGSTISEDSTFNDETHGIVGYGSTFNDESGGSGGSFLLF